MKLPKSKLKVLPEEYRSTLLIGPNLTFDQAAENANFKPKLRIRRTVLRRHINALADHAIRRPVAAKANRLVESEALRIDKAA